MNEIQNEQIVYVTFSPEYHGLNVTNAFAITKGEIVNNAANDWYNVKIELKGTPSIQQIHKENIHMSLQSALDKFAQHYGKPTTTNSSN